MFCILDWWTRVIFRWSDYFLVQIFQILSFLDSFFSRFFLYQILSFPDSLLSRFFLFQNLSFQNLSFPDSFFSRFFLFQILYFPDSFFFRFFLFQILSFSDSFFSQLVLVHLSFHQVRFFLFSVFRDCSCFDFFLRVILSKFCCCEFLVFISHLFSDSFFSRFSFGALFRAFGFGDVVCRCFGKFCVAITLFFLCLQYLDSFRCRTNFILVIFRAFDFAEVEYRCFWQVSVWTRAFLFVSFSLFLLRWSETGEYEHFSFSHLQFQKNNLVRFS